MKLTKLLKEFKSQGFFNGNMKIGQVYSNPYARSFVNEEGDEVERESGLNLEQKQAFLEAVKSYKKYSESIYRNRDLKEVYESIKNVVEIAQKMTIDETQDWFDGVTVSRHMKRMGESFKVFEKTLKEVSTLQQRLESAYDEIGEVLGKYYEINELEEGNEFGAARARAIAAGEDSFEVDGKTYKVTGVDKEDKENAKKFVGESINEASGDFDEWGDPRLYDIKNVIKKAKLNPKEKRYFLLRASEIKSKYDAVELLNDLDAMVKQKGESVNEARRAVGRIIYRGTGIEVYIDDGSLILLDMSDGQHIRLERRVTVTLLIKTLKKALKLMSENESKSVNEGWDVKDGNFRFVSKDGAVTVSYKGKKIAGGDFDRGADAYFIYSLEKPIAKLMGHNDPGLVPRGGSFDDKEAVLKYYKKLFRESKNESTKLTDILKKKVKSINEAKDIFFDSATEAVNHARKMIEKRGFEIDEDDWQRQIALGGRYGRFRPGKEKSTEATIGLLKNGKPQRKALQISLYGMPSGKYELTYYVN
jgi:hypothetical protein